MKSKYINNNSPTTAIKPISNGLFYDCGDEVTLQTGTKFNQHSELKVRLDDDHTAEPERIVVW